MMLAAIRQAATSSPRAKAGGMLLRPALRAFRDEIDPEGPRRGPTCSGCGASAWSRTGASRATDSRRRSCVRSSGAAARTSSARRTAGSRDARAR